MAAVTKLGAIKGWHPIRTSPAVGSARNSDFLHALAHVIEDGHSAIEQRLTVLGRHDPLPAPID
jgi:hypothetical protein